MIGRLLGRRTRDRPAPAVPPGTRVYAVGDVHGRADLLTMLHAAIRADADRAGAARRVLIHLGDYVDRGLQSREVLAMLAGDPLPGFERADLIGNHDAWMLDFLEDPAVGTAWLRNGGIETLYSFGVGRAPEGASLAQLAATSARLAAALAPGHLAFLDGLKRMHAEGDYVFVHAGIRPGVPLTEQREEDLLWIREPFLSDGRDHGAVVVHGHTITDMPEIRDNRIGIDTGAFATGHLTCLVLDGTSRHFLQT
ncbi:MAG: metallophosphoesterase [Alphaproteobacteria bacterium]